MDRNRALFIGLQVADRWLPRVPLSVAYSAATGIGTAAYFGIPSARRAVRSNLSVVLGRPASDRAVKRAARAAFCNDAKNWVDTLRISQLSGDAISACVELSGWENLVQALERGRGVVLVSLHLGNFDLVGQVLAMRGLQVTVPVERIQPDELFQFLTQLRASRGINTVPVERAPRAMIEALQRGEIVAIVGDRNTAGRGVRATFFGKTATVPRSPASLAHHCGSSVVIGVGVRKAGGNYHAVLTPPLELSAGSNGHDVEHENTQRITRALEPFIRANPEQWLAFSPVWPHAPENGSADTMGHQSEVAV